MDKKNFEAPALGKNQDGSDKIDPSFLNFRYVVNDGQNTVTLEPDPSFFDYLKEHGQKPIEKTILKSGQHAKLDNFFVIVTTNDGQPARLPQAFDYKGFLALNRAIFERQMGVKI